MLPPLPKKEARDPSGGKINDFPKAYRQCILASFIFIVIIVINNHQKPIYSIKKSSGIHVQREFYTSDVVGKTANVDNGPLLSELASLQKVNSDLQKILHAIDDTLSDPSQKEKRGKDMESEAISKKFAPLLKLNRRSISNSSTRSGPIVFCHVGTTIKFGEHVIVAMKQARQWNPEESIFMISSKSTTVGDGSGKLLRAHKQFPLSCARRRHSLAKLRRGNRHLRKRKLMQCFNNKIVSKKCYRSSFLFVRVKDVVHNGRRG